MKFVLIGNYPLDRQESMRRYTENLNDQIKKSGHDSEIWIPKVFFAYGQKTTTAGVSKWLGYLDKWILFPLTLKIKILKHVAAKSEVNYHICDHSNSPYLNYLPKAKTGITCHDVLAIRGAMGHKDAFCDATFFGKFLQKAILKNLKKAKILTTVSKLTMNQLIEMCSGFPKPEQNWKVIYNSFNADFFPMPRGQRQDLLRANGISIDKPFLLYVGSSLPRKNRKMLLEMLVSLNGRWDGVVCFAGQPLDNNLIDFALANKLEDRIISIVKPDHNLLVALYSSCSAFIFPSFSEGFGWPLIEAQACGAPVIASNIQPMPEISNGTALHADPYNPLDFATAFLQSTNEEVRSQLISTGHKNCLRFNREHIINEFLDLYNRQSTFS